MLRNPPPRPLERTQDAPPLSRWIWLLVPAALVGLLGIGIPLSQDLFALEPSAITEEETLVPLPEGTLAALEERSRAESRPAAFRALTNLIRETREAAERNGGQIPASLWSRLQAVMASEPGTRETGK